MTNIYQHKKTWIFLVLLVIFAVLFFASLYFGAAGSVFSSSITLHGDSLRVILVQLRLPRAIGAIISGLALSFSGILLQCVTDNELCAPNIIGINAGAGLGVIIILLAGFGSSALLISVGAFSGAMITVFLVLSLTLVTKGHNGRVTLLLVGIAVTALLNAFISFFSQWNTDLIESYAYFTTGGFKSVFLNDLILPALIVFPGCILAYLLSMRLNLLLLGDDIATSLGVRVRPLRFICVTLAALLSAASVALAGILGFVGLIVPHIGRKLCGYDLRNLFPVCALLGPSLVLAADLIGRTAFAPAEISAGVFLSAIGAPFFLFLLIRRTAK